MSEETVGRVTSIRVSNPDSVNVVQITVAIALILSGLILAYMALNKYS